ncbi:hypothetical protein BC830DRAFT_461313 [Chytriomyces sp. MP71]|nr:hypothetical protein BC830DRAFT_461313 [Chytriomyces sp. MP71]
MKGRPHLLLDKRIRCVAAVLVLLVAIACTSPSVNVTTKKSKPEPVSASQRGARSSCPQHTRRLHPPRLRLPQPYVCRNPVGRTWLQDLFFAFEEEAQ